MDRSEFLSYIKNQSISIQIGINILTEYCIEHKKDPNMTNIFIQLLVQTGQIEGYIHEAIEYYKKKFTICEVKKIDTNKVLYIF